jgi:hypothetical protein
MAWPSKNVRKSALLALILAIGTRLIRVSIHSELHISELHFLSNLLFRLDIWDQKNYCRQKLPHILSFVEQQSFSIL